MGTFLVRLLVPVLFVAGCAETSAGTSPPTLTAPPPTGVTTPPPAPATTFRTTAAPSATGAAAPAPTATTAPAALDCPVTLPAQPFSAPAPYPADYPLDGHEWYGTADLWTVLALDGGHSPRKSVWWSANFPGGPVEEQPPVRVTWTRLDADPPVVHTHDEPATNAYTPEEGWFMIAGLDPDEAGCWQVEATYKGATLSYVYERG